MLIRRFGGMQKLVYITSLSHSGSTLLDLILGGHSRFIGLGEIARVLEPGTGGLEKTRQVYCSCGVGMQDCIFWSKVGDKLEKCNELSLNEKYRIVFEVFNSVFGPDHIPVDSSKYISPLKTLREHHNLDLWVLYVIKDVRAYVISQIDDAKRENFGFIKKIPYYQFRSWYHGNKYIKDYICGNNIRYFQLGYEELCIDPETTISMICDFLGEEPRESMLTLMDSSSHVIRGNRMRSQPDKRQRISYDNRWFCRKEWLSSSIVFSRIMEYNAREVYGNGTTQKWSK
jgi:hypothetical protein